MVISIEKNDVSVILKYHVMYSSYDEPCRKHLQPRGDSRDYNLLAIAGNLVAHA